MVIRIPIEYRETRIEINNFDGVQDGGLLHLFRDFLAELEEGDLDARQRAADARIGRLLSSTLDDFENVYSTRILRSLDILERYAAIREDIAANRVVDDRLVRQLLEELRESDHERLDTPESALRQAEPISECYPTYTRKADQLEEFIDGRIRDILHRSPLGGQTEVLNRMDSITQQAVLRTLDAEPDLLLRAIVAEYGPDIWARESRGLQATEYPATRRLTNAMRERGMGDEDIRRLARSVTEMNRQHRNVQGSVERTLEIEALEEFLEQAPGELRERGMGEEFIRRFREEVTRGQGRYFGRLARSAQEMALSLYVNFRTRGVEGTFRNYVRLLMTRHFRGMVGEFTAAFQLGGGLTLLKGPDYDVTIPGTDLVGVCDITGDIWLIDNKAFTAQEVTAVDALTRNIPENLARDVAEFRAAQEGRGDIPPELSNAVQRLEEAMTQVREYTNGMTPQQVNMPEVQQEIRRKLDRLHIRRVVTNAHGNVSRLSNALQRRGIELENLNQIAESGNADRIAEYYGQFSEEEIGALVENIGVQE